MKKLLFIALFVVAFLNLKATHITHGNMYYQFIGTESNGDFRYKVTLVVIRDCATSQVSFDNTIFIGVYAKGLTDYSLETIDTISLKSERSINANSVLGTSIPSACYREGRYETEVILKSTVTDYYLTYTRCCHPTMTNIDADQTGNLFHVKIPISTTPFNASPVIFNEAPFVISTNAYYYGSFSHNDKDGDSLTYTLTDVISGGDPTNPIPQPSTTLTLPFAKTAYRNGYSSGQPFGPSPSDILLNNNTGDVKMFSASQGRYLIAYEVKEWRNGTVINTYYLEKEILSVGAPTITLNQIYLTATAPTTLIEKIDLHWQHNIQANDSGVFIIERRMIRTSNWNTIATLDSTILAYTDTTISFDSFYVYRVSAYVSGHLQVLSNEDSAIVRKNTVGFITPEIPNVSLYPNPTQNQLYIDAGNFIINKLVISNILGEVVKEIQTTENTATIDVSALPEGVYFVEIISENNLRTVKKIVKN